MLFWSWDTQKMVTFAQHNWSKERKLRTTTGYCSRALLSQALPKGCDDQYVIVTCHQWDLGTAVSFTLFGCQFKCHLLKEASPHQSHRGRPLQPLHRITQFYLPHSIISTWNCIYLSACLYFISTSFSIRSLTTYLFALFITMYQKPREKKLSTQNT